MPLLPRGGWGRHDPKPAIEVTTDFGVELAAGKSGAVEPPAGRNPPASACEPHRELIEPGLSRGCNAMAIWQDLVATNGFAAGYQSVRRFVWKLRGSRKPEDCAAIEKAAGEEARQGRLLAGVLRAGFLQRDGERADPAACGIADDDG